MIDIHLLHRYASQISFRFWILCFSFLTNLMILSITFWQSIYISLPWNNTLKAFNTFQIWTNFNAYNAKALWKKCHICWEVPIKHIFKNKQTITSLTFVVAVILQVFSSFPQHLSSFEGLCSFRLRRAHQDEPFLRQIRPLQWNRYWYIRITNVLESSKNNIRT